MGAKTRQKGNRALAERSADAFATCIESIYAAATLPSHWPQALRSIAGCFDDVGAAILYTRSDGTVGTIVSPELLRAQQDYERYWGQHDIRAIRGIPILHQQETLTDRHVVSEQEVREHAIYREFLIPHGLGWFAAVRISPDPKIMVLISVQRSFKKPPFSDDELELLLRLGAHAEHSLRLSIRLMNAELVNAGLQEALSRIGAGVVVLDGDRRVLFANSAAQQHLGNGLVLSNDRLTAQFGAGRSGFNSAIDAASCSTRVDTLPILLQRVSRVSLVAYILPLPSILPFPSIHDESVDHLLRDARVIVLLLDPQNAEQPDPALVRDLLGLTLSEARVAALVGSGLRPREAATKLGITEETARSALKHVFGKVGVSRQSELAALLSRLALH